MKNRIYFFVYLTLIGFCLATNQKTTAQQPDYRFVFENPQILSFDIAMSAEAYEQMQPEQQETNSPFSLTTRSSRTIPSNSKKVMSFAGCRTSGIDFLCAGFEMV